ncbi:MAG: Rieske 2Fe-2S domain-containing protein [Burkholderiales bacterium]|nr:Rieske 2Fe-2S domain-containing protein [Burkholderiales bacterium]
MAWIKACSILQFAQQQIIRFDYGSDTFAIFKSPDGDFFATAGYCTHERAHLADGNVYGFEIECPRHLGAFDYRTGEAILAPACIDLRTFAVRIEGEDVLIDI